MSSPNYPDGTGRKIREGLERGGAVIENAISSLQCYVLSIIFAYSESKLTCHFVVVVVVVLVLVLVTR